MVAPPGITADEAAFRRDNMVIVCVAAALAGAGLVGPAFFLSGIGLLANAQRHGREFSYRSLLGLGGMAFLAFLAGDLIQHWPDVKQGFLDGYHAGRATF